MTTKKLIDLEDIIEEGRNLVDQVRDANFGDRVDRFHELRRWVTRTNEENSLSLTLAQLGVEYREEIRWRNDAYWEAELDF